MRRGLYLPPFDELADPRPLAELAALAEARGWDGVFLWDRIAYPPADRPVADVWVALAAVAMATERLRLGPMVIPLARRRIEKVAREAVTLDLLAQGRLTVGVGLGNVDDFAPFGEVVDARERARLLDAGLDRLAELWDGAFQPQPVQRPRTPIWVAANWPHRRPVRRAARWDGLFPIDLPGPDALAELAAEVAALRPAGAGPFDLIVELPPEVDPQPWAASGATWVLTALDPQPRPQDARAVIAAGPG